MPFEIYNKNVISLGWRVFLFLEEDRRDVLQHWEEREPEMQVDRQALLARLVLCEQLGPDALPGFLLHLKDDFYTMQLRIRKGTPGVTPICCYGPFGDRELTILAMAPIARGLIGPKCVLPVAKHNLETLRQDWKRRRMLCGQNY